MGLGCFLALWQAVEMGAKIREGAEGVGGHGMGQGDGCSSISRVGSDMIEDKQVYFCGSRDRPPSTCSECPCENARETRARFGGGRARATRHQLRSRPGASAAILSVVLLATGCHLALGAPTDVTDLFDSSMLPRSVDPQSALGRRMLQSWADPAGHTLDNDRDQVPPPPASSLISCWAAQQTVC